MKKRKRARELTNLKIDGENYEGMDEIIEGVESKLKEDLSDDPMNREIC